MDIGLCEMLLSCAKIIGVIVFFVQRIPGELVPDLSMSV